MGTGLRAYLNLNVFSRLINGLVIFAVFAAPFMAQAQLLDSRGTKQASLTVKDLDTAKAVITADTKLKRIGVNAITNGADTKSVSKLKQVYEEKIRKNQKQLQLQGGVDSGGGSLVTRNGQTGLLDLYLYNQDAFYAKQPGQKLPRTASLKAFGFARMSDLKSVVFTDAISIVKQWQVTSPVVAGMVLKALSNLPLYYVDYQLGFVDKHYFLPQGTDVVQSEITTAAIYVGGIGVFVSLIEYEKLSASSQIALIIHEALRHAQITYDLNLTNDYIQRLTAALMTSPENRSLDEMGFVQGKILMTELKKIIIPVEVNDVVGRACLLKQSIGLLSLKDQIFCDQKEFEVDENQDSSKQYLAIIKKMRLLAQLPDENLSLEQVEKFSSMQSEIYNLCTDLNTVSVGLVLDRGVDSLMSLNKVTRSPLDIFITDFDEKGWLLSPSRIQAIELRNRFLQDGIFK